MTHDENWLPVRDYPDHYEISDVGRLRRTQHYHPGNAGKIRKPVLAKNGYVVYMLSRANQVKLCSAHRMVADAFLGPIPEGMQVNHINGDKGDNRVANLEIVTNSENRIHSYRVLGIRPNKSVETNVNAKLTWKTADAIRAFGVNRMTILRLLNNRAWREIDRPPSLA